MFGRIPKDYMKGKYGNLPEVEVTKNEFIKMMMKEGKTKKEAELQATFAITLGSSVMIGNKKVKIKEESK